MCQKRWNLLYDKTGVRAFRDGILFMEAFMDRLEVVSEPGKGTSVHMVRRLGNQEG